MDEVDLFPEEIQLLPPDKQREQDPAIRGILLDALILQCSSRPARESMRQQNVYRIIQMMHKVETDEDNKERANRLVGLLIRDEEREDSVSAKITSIDDVDETVQEV